MCEVHSQSDFKDLWSCMIKYTSYSAYQTLNFIPSVVLLDLLFPTILLPLSLGLLMSMYFLIHFLLPHYDWSFIYLPKK